MSAEVIVVGFSNISAVRPHHTDNVSRDCMCHPCWMSMLMAIVLATTHPTNNCVQSESRSPSTTWSQYDSHTISTCTYRGMMSLQMP
eukprot:1178270-Prorocentrum_minimum.AAC.5